MNSHEWLATECAPEDAPAYVVDGLLTHPGGAAELPARRIAANGWGRRGSTRLVGALRKPAPDGLQLTWFSYCEDRAYQGRFVLPQARIDALMAKGVVAGPQRQRKPWDRVVVGMAPGGAVAVWLAAGATTFEVATFRATPVNLPWERVLDNPAIPRAQHVRAVLASAAPVVSALARAEMADPIKTSLRRHTPWHWAPAVARHVDATRLVVRGWNGEFEPFLVDGAFPPRTRRASPRELQFDWTDRARARRSARVSVDEDEVYRAFARLAGPAGSLPITLHLEPEAEDRELAVVLRSRHGTLRLREGLTQVFRDRP